MNDSNLKYLIGLSHFPKFGPRRLKKIKRHFSSLENAFNSSPLELIKAGIEENIASEFISARTDINLEKIITQMDQEKISAVSLEQKAYPALLKEIYDPPALLYYKGELEGNNEFSLAIVGTRKYTSYGKQITEDIAFALAKNQLTIVSGLALGIDTLAHTACLSARGRTIAVLGSGLDKQSVYPSSNRYLLEKIATSGGLVISEFPLGTPPLRYNFPQRNRIISGLSLGTLVIEAAEKSGALITASCALEQNREVFAVPGNVYSPVSAGPNNLIKQGARMVTSAEEIMEALDLKAITSYIENKKIIPETPEEESIIKNLNHEATHVNELIRATGLNAAVINRTLVIMEMKGMVKNLGNMEYVLGR